MDIVIVVLTSLTLMGMGVILLGIVSLFNTLNRHTEINITSATNLNLLLQRINKLESDTIRTNDTVQNTKIRIETVLERLWRMESTLTLVMSTTQNFMSGLEQLANEGSPARGLMSDTMEPGHIIRATSMEDFLQKIQADPYFRNITPEQLEE